MWVSLTVNPILTGGGVGVILWNCYQSIYMVFIDYFTILIITGLNIIKLDRRNDGRIKDR